MKVYPEIVFTVTFLLGSQILLSAYQLQAIKLKDATNFNQQVSQAFSNINASSCLLDVQRDLPKSNKPQPLYIVPKTEQIWFPNSRGFLEIPHGASIELYCSTSFENVTTVGDDRVIPKNTLTLKPVCDQGRTFLWQNRKYIFREFLCKKPVGFIVEELNENCGGTGQIYRVGHNITDNRFVETKRVCYDNNILRNHYTQHRLQPGSVHFQRHVDRLEFNKAGYFSRVNMNSIYMRRNQKQQALKILKDEDAVEKLFPGSNIYLARGHLAAKSDAIYANQQRSSFIFHNIAPQWQSFNGGQWSTLETEVRKFVNKANLDVDCYTGTWGTLDLTSPKNKNVKIPFYLSQDAKKNGILPVPKLFFRVIVDRNQPQRGIALIGVNNPHATIEEIRNAYIICKDISTTVTWLHWIQRNNLKTGFIYACTVNDFHQAVAPILPEYLKTIVELLN